MASLVTKLVWSLCGTITIARISYAMMANTFSMAKMMAMDIVLDAIATRIIATAMCHLPSSRVASPVPRVAQIPPQTRRSMVESAVLRPDKLDLS